MLNTVNSTKLRGLAYSFIAPGAASTPNNNGDTDTTPAPRVVFFGDSGNSLKWSQGTVVAVAAEVTAKSVAAIIHTGDMAYYSKDDDGQRGGIHAEELSNATGHVVPLMTVPGNGDVFCYRAPTIPAWAACTEDYQRRYIMPGWDRTHSLGSSFTLGVVHYLLLDSEAHTWCNGSQNHTQLAFAKADLTAVNRTTTPSTSVLQLPQRERTPNNARRGFATLFAQHSVDVVFNGHVHSYERTYPVMGDYFNITNATAQTNANMSEQK